MAAVVAAIGMAVGGAVAATAAQTAPAPAFEPAPIAWGQCASAGLRARGAECGFLAVPLDHAAPEGEKVEIAVSRIKAKVPADQHQGVMLVNPGGPGGSGLTLPVLGEYVPGGAGSSYDWVGFDPRGVGSSKPALTCDSTYMGYNRPHYVPVSRNLERTWLDRSRGYAEDCAAAGGALLRHVKTTDTVADMDLLRRALGQEKINFYGFSYGTYLGQVYATTHPDRVRRMVLDGNVDPRKVWYQANLDQDVAFDRNIKVYFDWIAKHDAVYGLGDTGAEVEALFYREQATLLREPAGGVIGPSEWTDVFLQAGYYVFGWEDVAKAFAAWVHNRDIAPAKALYDAGASQQPGGDNGYAMYLATECTDAPWPKDWKRWRADHWRIHLRAPFETWGNAWFNAPCLFWPAPAAKPARVKGEKAPPILLISETLDAATTFEGSLEVRTRFPRSALIEGVGGTTHSGSLFGNACVDDQVAAYLADGTLPARKPGRRSDAQCDPHPQPTPAAPAEQRSAQAHGEGADLSRMDLQRLILGARN